MTTLQMLFLWIYILLQYRPSFIANILGILFSNTLLRNTDIFLELFEAYMLHHDTEGFETTRKAYCKSSALSATNRYWNMT